MKRPSTVILVCALLCMTALFVSGPGSDSAGYTVDAFADGRDSVEITFTGPGTDTGSASIELGPNTTLDSALLRISSDPSDSGSLPWNVSVDVGDDGDDEWRFTGEGYGRMGHQEFFNDSSEAKFVTIGSSGHAPERHVRLPKDAHVTSASLEVQPYGTNYPLDKTFPTGFSTNGPVSACRGLKFVCNSANLQVIELGCIIPPAYVSSSARWVTLWNFATQAKLAQVQITTPFTGGQWVFAQLATPVTLTQGSTYVVAEWGTGYYYGGSGMSPPWNGDSHITYSGTQYANSCTKDTFPTSFLGMVYGVPDIGYSFGGTGLDGLELNVGPDDSKPEWDHPGTIDSATKSVDLADGFNDYLASATVSGTDGFGNRYVDVPINLSSGDTGALMVRNLTIDYEYEAVIDVSPHGRLVKEINSHIKDITENVTVPIAVHSDKAGKVTLSGLNLSYNAAPWFRSKLSSVILECYEDTPEPYLLDLSQWASDDIDGAQNLTYSIHSNSLDDLVDIAITDDWWLGVDPSKTPDWNSEAGSGGLLEARVRITDSLNRSTVSPVILVDVLPVNDEPVVGLDIPDVAISEGESETVVSLMSKAYFTDTEFDALHYTVAIDPLNAVTGEEGNVTAEINPGNNVLSVEGLGDYYTGEGPAIPLWVYADDDSQVNTHEDGYVDEGSSIPNWTHQEVLLTIYNSNDEPVWGDIPDLLTDEDVPVPEAFLLSDHVTDIDSDPETWEFKVKSNSNKRLMVVLDQKTSAVSLEPAPNAFGNAKVEVEVSDGEDKARTTFKVNVASVNDIPTVSVFSPEAGASVMGNVTFTGAADDVEDTLGVVEVSTDGGEVWSPVQGTAAWTWVWDTTPLPNGPASVMFRSFDGEAYSGNFSLDIVIANPVNEPPLVLITYPGPGELVDPGEMTIRGTSADNDGTVMKVMLLIGGGVEWITIKDAGAGLIQWSYEFNNSQWAGEELTIVAKAYDGGAFSEEVNLNFSVDEPTIPPPPPPPPQKEGGSSYWWLWIILVIVVLTVVMLLLVFKRRNDRLKAEEEEEERRKEEEEKAAAGRAAAVAAQLQVAASAGPAPGAAGWSPPGAPPVAYGPGAAPATASVPPPPPALPAAPMPTPVAQLPPPPPPGAAEVPLLPPAPPTAAGPPSAGAPPAATAAPAAPGTLPPPPAPPAAVAPPPPPSTGAPPLSEVSCYVCGGMVPITSTARPLSIQCPSCGAKGEI